MSAASLHRHVLLNGRLIGAGEAMISPLGEGFMYGRGLFETIRLRRGQPVFFAEHYERLARSAVELGLDFTTVADALRRRCHELIVANGVSDGALKIVIFAEADCTGELIQTRELTYTAEMYARGFRLKTRVTARAPGGITGLKTLNYLENIRAKQEAQAAGYDEALFIRESEAAGPGSSPACVLEGATSNIFVVAGGEVLTPPLSAGILPGVVRARVLRLLQGRKASERPVSLALLRAAEEVFITNSLLGIMPVSAVDDQIYPRASPSVTASIAAALSDAEK